MKNFDYWMLGIIEQDLQKNKRNSYFHANCSNSCENRFCEIGSRNLIHKRINEIREGVSDNFEDKQKKRYGFMCIECKTIMAHSDNQADNKKNAEDCCNKGSFRVTILGEPE